MLAPRLRLALLWTCIALGVLQRVLPAASAPGHSTDAPAAVENSTCLGQDTEAPAAESGLAGELQTLLEADAGVFLQTDLSEVGLAATKDPNGASKAEDSVASSPAELPSGVYAVQANASSNASEAPRPVPQLAASDGLPRLSTNGKPTRQPAKEAQPLNVKKKDPGSRWFDAGSKRSAGSSRKRNHNGKGGSITAGTFPKLDKWGAPIRPRRKGYYLPALCFAFPGLIFTLFHIHRSPWKPPMNPEDQLGKAGSDAPTHMSSTASTVSRRHSRPSTMHSTSSLTSERSRILSGGTDADDTFRQDSFEAKRLSSKIPPLRRRKTEYGFVDKMFLKHWNRSFGENAQLTVRGAALALIAGLPLILPETYFPWLQQFQKTGFWSVGAITLFIFTLWKTAGETLSYAWYGIFGTFLAAIDIWVMFGIFPGGVTEISPPYVFWVGVLNGMIFIVVILWLNMDDNTKIFALMNFVWFWMAFLDPERSDVFSEKFGVQSGTAEVTALLAAISGSGLAVTATLLPFPLWALGKACQGSFETVTELGLLWSHAVECYCAPKANPFETDRLVRDLLDVHNKMHGISEHLRNSWWECFGLGSWGRVRRMVRRLNIAVQDESDRLYCVLNAMLNAEKHDKDTEVFAGLEDRIRDVITEAQSLFLRNASAACRGGYTTEEGAYARRGVQRMQEAMTALTLDFRDIKQESGGPKLSEGLLDEHAFCYNLCALGRLAIKFTEDLLKIQVDGTMQHLPEIQESVGFWGVFDRKIIFEGFYLVYVVRTSLRIFACFYIGYHGYSNVVRGKNAGIAIPATLLLMRYTGSAIQKNAKRLQAVVLGTVTGILIHAMVGQCVWWGYAATGVAYFFWLLLTLFIYFDTIDNSYSGLLMAYFGTMGILRGCNDRDFDPILTHYPITNTVVAIFVVTFFDTLFHPGRASDAAYEAYKEVWLALEEAVREMFDPQVSHVQFHRDEIMALVAHAARLGEEASIEPRWWRIPWPKLVYERVIQSSYQLCACLSNMERTAAKAGQDGAPKDEVFKALLSVQTFQGLGSVLLAKMKQMEKLIKIFAHETTGPMAELDSPDMLVGYLRDESEARRRFLEEVQALEGQTSVIDEEGVLSPGDPLTPPQKKKEPGARATLKRRLSYTFQVDTLEADPAAQVSLLLSDMDQMIRTMRFMHHTILRN